MRIVLRKLLGWLPAWAALLVLVNACTLEPLTPGSIAGKTETPVLPTTGIEYFPTPSPTPNPTPTPEVKVCTETSGQVNRFDIPSNLLKEPLTVSVYTPPCFSLTPDKPYPVLYLLHGQGQDDTIWDNLGVFQIVDQAIAAGETPFLIVMPYEVWSFDDIDKTPFPNAVIAELIPWVEQNYPVCVERECRAIGGVSRGAGWAVHLALTNFDLFSSVGAHSVGLMAGDWRRVYKLRETYPPEAFPRFYIDRGETDFLAEYIDLLRDTLKDNGIAYEYHVSRGDHGTAYWRAHIAEYMQWYMQGWQ